GPGLDGTVTSVSAGEHMLVAVGLRQPNAQDQMGQAAAWTSTDGESWTAEPLPDNSTPHWLTVAATASGFTAVNVNIGSSADGQAAAHSWTREADPGAAWHAFKPMDDQRDARFVSVAASRDGGSLIIGLSSDQRPLLVASREGSDWVEVPVLGEFPIQSFIPVAVTAAGGQFVVAGVDMRASEGTVLAGLAYIPSAAELASMTPQPLPPTPEPTPSPTPMPAAAVADGVATLTIENLEGFVPQADGSATCTSTPGGTAVSSVNVLDAGGFRGFPVTVSLQPIGHMADGGRASVYVHIARADGMASDSMNWMADGTVDSLAADGMAGTITFANAEMLARPEGSQDWPQTMSGSIAWRCDPWADGEVAPGPYQGGTGELDVTLTGVAVSGEAGPAMCSTSGSQFSLSAQFGQVNDVPVQLSISAQGALRAGRPLVGTLMTGTTEVASTPVLVAISSLGPNATSGTGTLRSIVAPPDWPAGVTGAFSWHCPGRTDTPQAPLPACKVTTAPPGSMNLALRRSVTASSFIRQSPTSQAVDGRTDNLWNSGAYAFGWIEVDLGKVVAVSELRLITAQSPSGWTEHHVYGRATIDGEQVEIARCGGLTSDNSALALPVDASAPAVRYVRVVTVASPSWVAWREIQVLAKE
ncbi:MAG TPA: discoidin domain-containing protein, partial [Candidatus Limnocylindria bacterium]